MEATSFEWTRKAGQLSLLLKSGRSDEKEVIELLEELSSFTYPVHGLNREDVSKLVGDVVSHGRVRSDKYTIQVAQLVSKLLTLQKVSVAAEARTKLFDAFISSLPTASPPTELLYGAASLLQDGTIESPSLNSEALLGSNSLVLAMALDSAQYSINIRRAALNFVTTLCGKLEVARTNLLTMMDGLLYSLLNPPGNDVDSLLKAKLVLSQLKCLHSCLSLLATIQSYPSLSTLLAALKSSTVTGLPGQTKAIPSIQPPLSIPPSFLPTQHQLSSTKQKPQSVAGPQGRKKQHKNKSRDRGASSSVQREKKDGGSGGGGGGVTPDHSSDSDTASSSSSATSLVASVGRKGRHRPSPRGSESPMYTSSDSDLSDSEPAPNRLKMVNGKIRFQAHSCLTLIFQKLDRQTSFTYWRSFLPDCPRLPNSPPSLLTCIVKDPTPKCRGGAVSVLCALLEGSKTFLAAADDRPRPAQPYTPYSTTLGSIVRELHRSLLLALTAESHPTTLTQLIKALSVLVANAPYHKLSEGYITKIVTTLVRFSRHKDSDVQVACLTCFGAAVSIVPPLKEVEAWLSGSDHAPLSSSSPLMPWLVQHCIVQLQSHSTLAVQTEALQVLSALCKFYFTHLSPCWSQLRDLYLLHLSKAAASLQQHVLKMLEELLRALSTAIASSEGQKEDGGLLMEVCQFWEELLGGSLATYLSLSPSSSSSTEHNFSLTSQACNVLATVGAPVMATLKAPFRTLALTLPLGLCREESASTAATASAVRVLGVFVLYDCLRTDDSFLLDCHSIILHCLSSTHLPVRVQASWALANLTDILPSSFPSPLLISLHEAIVKASTDNDKVKCNAVRAAGNMLKGLQEQVIPLCESSVPLMCTNLSKCINSGSMKSRWNACYACHSAFSNSVFIHNFSDSVVQLLNSLCLAVQKCKNFKVRSNAALALSTVAAAYYPLASGEQFVAVWGSLLQALENSHHQGDFSEYKHAATLRSQICSSVCHTLAAMTAEQAAQLSSSNQPTNEALSTHMSEFMLEAVKQESGDLLELIHKAKKHLTSINASPTCDDPATQKLLQLWLQLLTEPVMETEALTAHAGHCPTGLPDTCPQPTS